MKLSDHILKRLSEVGIDTCFLVYGGAMGELADAFTRQSKIKYICAQHEQGAVFMAEGYAKVKGVPGFVLVTSGPGVGNIITGLQNCYYDSTPLIAITGQVASTLTRPPKSQLRQRGFQETPAAEIVRPITKFSMMVDGALHGQFCLETAIKEAMDGRPGPIVLDIPIDIQKREIP